MEAIPGADYLHGQGPEHHAGLYPRRCAGQDHSAEDGWYNTGDVVAIDADGYIAILGGGLRFAKIGGETVSLAVVENIAAALWPDNTHAAVAVPDGRKGEQVVLVTNAKDARRMDLIIGWAQNHGVSEISVPRRVLVIDAIPMLATGKTNYVAVQKMAEAGSSKRELSNHAYLLANVRELPILWAGSVRSSLHKQGWGAYT